ncbi:MAG: hypothetical protein QW214_00090 [Saccharolobus sp.]
MKLSKNSSKPIDLCPIVSTISMIGSEPKLLIIRYLLEGPKRFNELQRTTRLSSKTKRIGKFRYNREKIKFCY